MVVLMDKYNRRKLLFGFVNLKDKAMQKEQRRRE
jgi:hypothetical protein